jgi:hypothetical protein
VEPAPDPTEVRDAVLRNAQAGLPMFRTNGKTPIEPNGFKDATLDLGELVERWKERPDAGIGLPTGAESGKTAIDVDPRHGGDETLARLEAEHGALPPTAKQVTPSGGWHLIFDYEPRLRTGAGRLGPGLDVRNDGGYVVIAPSRGYRWERPLLGGTVPLPGWVLEISNRNGGPAQNVPTSGSSDIPHRMPEQIPYGRQHDHLVSLAGSMRRRGMSEAAIAAALIAENDERCERPGSHENMRKLARSAMQWEPESGVDFKPPPPPEPLDDAPSQLPYRAFKEVISNLPPEPEWLWEGYVGRGFITLSFAPFKTGKTTLLFGLLRARERGDEEFLGRKVGTGTTLLLTEEGSRTLLDKAFTFDITGDHIEVLLRNEVLDKNWEQIADDAIRRCREQGHDLLVIDTAAPGWTSRARRRIRPATLSPRSVR